MMDIMKKYLTLLLLAVVSVATGAGCSSNDKPVQITSLKLNEKDLEPVSYTHLRAHET